MAGNGYVDQGAEIDSSGLYRYTLWRAWDPTKGRVLFVMLNPSTADASVDDRTISRCVGFARTWGYGRLDVANLFAFRSSDRSMLTKVPDPVGPENDRHLVALAKQADFVVAAWGNDGTLLGRSAKVASLLAQHRDVHALRRTQSGEPWHPLYLAGDIKPMVVWPKAGR